MHEARFVLCRYTGSLLRHLCSNPKRDKASCATHGRRLAKMGDGTEFILCYRRHEPVRHPSARSSAPRFQRELNPALTGAAEPGSGPLRRRPSAFCLRPQAAGLPMTVSRQNSGRFRQGNRAEAAQPREVPLLSTPQRLLPQGAGLLGF